MNVYLNGIKINPKIYGRTILNYVTKEEVKTKMPCERYSRTVGYYAIYENLNKGKKSERDERVYLKTPENLNG